MADKFAALREKCAIKTIVPKENENSLLRLATTIYSDYLSKNTVKRIVTTKKQSKNVIIAGPFENLTPYIITFTSYITVPLNRAEFFKSIRCRNRGRIGEILFVGDGTKFLLEDGTKIKNVKISNPPPNDPPGCLPNHITLLLRLQKDRIIQIRASSTKIEAIACKTDNDLLDAWALLTRHIRKAIRRGYQLFEDNMIPKLTSPYAAMRNYNFNFPFKIDERKLLNMINIHPEYGFDAFVSPSMHPGVKICCPADIEKHIPSQYLPGGKYHKPTKKKKREKPHEHVFKFFYSGNCLLSSKGDIEETERIYNIMLNLIMNILRPYIEVKDE